MKLFLKSGPTSNSRWYLAIALLAVVAGWGAFQALPQLYPKLQINAVSDPGCDLRAGSCTTALDDGHSVRFSIEPKAIPPLLPLVFRVDTLGFTAQAVNVDLNGIGMHMGLNRVPLSRHSEGYFTGTGSLSVCIRDVMEWEALVTLETEDAQISAPFRFITVKNGVRQ